MCTILLIFFQSSRTLKQLHYINWPDHGVPDSIPPILDMLHEMRSYQAHDDIPICIHCRSGIWIELELTAWLELSCLSMINILLTYEWSGFSCSKMSCKADLYFLIDNAYSVESAITFIVLKKKVFDAVWQNQKWIRMYTA